MRPVFRLLICIALLWACVGVRPVTAEDVDGADCFKTGLTPVARFVACRVAAEAGLVDAQFNLGGMYDVGLGVPQDYAEAAKWYGRAAEQGDARAQLNSRPYVPRRPRHAAGLCRSGEMVWPRC